MRWSPPDVFVLTVSQDGGSYVRCDRSSIKEYAKVDRNAFLGAINGPYARRIIICLGDDDDARSLAMAIERDHLGDDFVAQVDRFCQSNLTPSATKIGIPSSSICPDLA